MPRPKGATKVSSAEKRKIFRLFHDGMRLEDICRATGRSMSVVQRTTRGLKLARPKRPRHSENDRRDANILRLAERGLSRSQIAEKVGLSPNRVSVIIATHPEVIRQLTVRKLKPETVAKRYRMEVSTAERIAAGGNAKSVPRTRRGSW